MYTDKSGPLVYEGRYFYLLDPDHTIVEWHKRVCQITLIAKEELQKYYGVPPEKTYARGLSNGGYRVRYALENLPEHFDGGLDVAGVLWTMEGPDLFTSGERRCKAKDYGSRASI